MRSHAEEVSANSRQAAEEAEHGYEVLKKSVQEIRGVEKTVSSMNEGCEAVVAGAQSVENLQKVFEQIQALVENGATEQQSASSEEIASASETLSNMAREQQQALRQFKF